MKNKYLYLEMAKQFDLYDKQGNLPKVGDIAVGIDFLGRLDGNGYLICFGVYKKEVLDYYDTYFDGCGFYLERLDNKKQILGLGLNSKNFVFLTKKEYTNLLEERKNQSIREKERKIQDLQREINNLK